MYYIEIPQEVTNENTSCNTTDGLINAHFIIEALRLITDI